MKMKNLFLLACLSVVAMTGCTNTDDEVISNSGEQVIGIQLPANTIHSRAVEDQEATGKVTKLEDVTVFLMVGQTVNKVVEFSPEEIISQFKRITNVSSMVNKVIVVANKQDQMIEDLTTESQILSYKFDVKSQHSAEGVAEKTHIGVSTDLEPAQNPETDGYDKRVEVQLNAITSRIEVGTVRPGVGVANVELVAVYVNNYFADNSKQDSVFHSYTDPVWDTDPGAGVPSISEFGDITFPNNYSEPFYTDKASPLVTLDDNSPCYAYHVFSGNLPHVILLVKGEYKDDYYEDGKKYFLGWLTFSKYKRAANDYVNKMMPNMIYKMGVGSTGILVDAKDITDRPEKEGYTLQVNVKVNPWTAEVVTPEI